MCNERKSQGVFPYFAFITSTSVLFRTDCLFRLPWRSGSDGTPIISFRPLSPRVTSSQSGRHRSPQRSHQRVSLTAGCFPRRTVAWDQGGRLTVSHAKDYDCFILWRCERLSTFLCPATDQCFARERKGRSATLMQGRITVIKRSNLVYWYNCSWIFLIIIPFICLS